MTKYTDLKDTILEMSSRELMAFGGKVRTHLLLNFDLEDRLAGDVSEISVGDMAKALLDAASEGRK